MNNLISAFIGGLITIMIMINGNLSNTAGNYTATVVIHSVGLISVILVLIINKSNFKITRDIPIYMYSAGAIGVFTVLFNNVSFIKLGASLPIALGLLGQSVSSIIIDHFGLLEMKVVKFKKEKIIGLILITLGIVIMTIY